jgi:hypothetical protein
LQGSQSIALKSPLLPNLPSPRPKTSVLRERWGVSMRSSCLRVLAVSGGWSL